MTSRLESLRDRHRGERVVLVANGPSLNRMDLGFLKREYVIGLNKIFLGIRKLNFYPRYYVAVNRKVIEQSVDEINHLNAVKFIGNRGNRNLINEDALTYLINTATPCYGFCRNIAHGVTEGSTVTYAALQVAYHLGFSEVVIIGLDHRYDYTGQPNESRVLHGPDPNHFSPDYFGHGQAWDNPDLKRSEASYETARAEFEQDGRRIVDATVDGGCTVFTKAHYQDIFS